MTNWITAIATTILMLATVFLAIAAWQAKKSFLQENLYNDSWELYKKWNDLIIWIFNNKIQLDNELIKKEKTYCDMFKEKLDFINFLYIKVKHLYDDKLKQMGLLLTDLDSVWLSYATKQSSTEVNKYKLKIIQKLTNDEEIPSSLYNNILKKMKLIKG